MNDGLTSLLENSTKAYPLGLPLSTPDLWNMKSNLVILPYFEKTWMRVYSSTVGDKLPTKRRSGLPEAVEEGAEVEAEEEDGPAWEEGPAEKDMVVRREKGMRNNEGWMGKST